MHGTPSLSSALRPSVARALIPGLLLGLAAMPSAALAAPAQGEASAVVVRPLSFINYENLDFGRIIPATVAGTVTISTTNVRTQTNGIVLIGNDFQVARFAGRGVQNQRVRIQITPATVTLAGPGPAMTVSNLVIGPGTTLQQNGSSPNYRIVPANGIFFFTVGGRLNVGAKQPAGAYSGTFTATLDYQ